jgi:hypothetical protein
MEHNGRYRPIAVPNTIALPLAVCNDLSNRRTNSSSGRASIQRDQHSGLDARRVRRVEWSMRVMGRAVVVPRVKLAAATASVLVICLATVGASGTDAAGTPSALFNGCPHGAAALPAQRATSYRAVRRLAVRFVHGPFAQLNARNHWRLQLRGAVAEKVIPVRQWLGGGWAQRVCGKTDANRSLAVAIRLPAMERVRKPKCMACARIVLITARANNGWLFWAHA